MRRLLRRVAPGVLLLSLLAALALLSSCSLARAYVAVLQGNYAYERGSYQQATVRYLEARKSGSYSSRVAYDLGNVYHALGEPEGAQTEWTKAEKSNDQRVVAATLFNEGILDYELGRYRDAYDRFRRVLEMTPEDIEAKIDLELSFEKMTTPQVPPRGATQAQPVTVKHTNREANQLLNIIRRQQEGYFTPPPSVRSPPHVADW